MKSIKSMFLLLMMLAMLWGSMSAEIVDAPARSVPDPDHNALALIADAALLDMDGAVRLVEDLNIWEDGSNLILSWSPVQGATSYKVYSSESLEPGFIEDSSGSFNGMTWTTQINATRRFYYVTSISPDPFIFIPGGTFTMGDTRGVGLPNELPAHSVTLNPYYIGRYEVTQNEWQAVMGSSPCAEAYGLGNYHPVYSISWYNILIYCNLRSMTEGLTPVYSISGSSDPADWGDPPITSNAIWNAAVCNWNASGYRMPTEAEWEYAARGATNMPDYLYSGSDDMDAVAWNQSNAYDVGSDHPDFGTHPVGTKAPNGIGAYDMSGNVQEWCWDWSSNTYYSSSPAANPTGPDNGSHRVMRGGGWTQTTSCRVTRRGQWYPYIGLTTHGLRLCRTGLQKLQLPKCGFPGK